MSILIIQPSGKTEVVDRPGEPSLAELQAWVGGYIEVPGGDLTDQNGKKVQVVCNEEGRLKRMAYNLGATRRYHLILGRQADVLVGPVVILTEPNLMT